MREWCSTLSALARRQPTISRSDGYPLPNPRSALMPMAQHSARRTQYAFQPITRQMRIPSRRLFLLPGTNVRLPSSGFLAWRRGNCLDLRLLGFLGFPITSLLATGHVALPWVFDTLMRRRYLTVRLDQRSVRLCA